MRHIDQLWRARNRELSEKSALDDTEIADMIAFPGHVDLRLSADHQQQAILTRHQRLPVPPPPHLTGIQRIHRVRA
jgi:hypothetical protein